MSLDFEKHFKDLKEFDYNSMNDIDLVAVWPLAIKVLCVLGALILSLLISFLLIVKPELQVLSEKKQQEVQFKKKFEEKSFSIRNIDSHRESKKDLEQIFSSLLRRLPSDAEVPGLLEDISKVALKNNLKIESMELQPELSFEFHKELPINIQAVGQYHQIGLFLSEISQLARIITFHDFDMKSELKSSMVKLKIKAKTYRYVQN